MWTGRQFVLPMTHSRLLPSKRYVALFQIQLAKSESIRQLCGGQVPVWLPSAHSMQPTQSFGRLPMLVFLTSVHSETFTPLPNWRLKSVPWCPDDAIAGPRGGPRGRLRSSCQVSQPQLLFHPQWVSTLVQQLEA